MHINGRKLVNLYLDICAMDCILHPIRNRFYWFASFGILLSGLAMVEFALPAATAVFNVVCGNSTSNMPVVSFTPGVDTIVVKNNTEHHVSDIQYDVPIYQCPADMPKRYYSAEAISNSSCLRLRGLFGLKEANRFQVSSGGMDDVGPGQTVVLIPMSRNFDNYMAETFESDVVTEGYHIVESDPIFVGAVNK